jgi:hypothetical protein
MKGDPIYDAAFCRMQAAEARQTATMATEKNRQMYLVLADEWDALAKDIQASGMRGRLGTEQPEVLSGGFPYLGR